jgi:hypothetical protein
VAKRGLGNQLKVPKLEIGKFFFGAAREFGKYFYSF